MGDAIPQWAIERACELANAADPLANWRPANLAPDSNVFVPGSMKALARYIAEHEEPPIDPLLIEAREIAGKFYIDCGGGHEPNHSADIIRKGEGDNTIAVQCALAAIRRGIEIASERQS